MGLLMHEALNHVQGRIQRDLTQSTSDLARLAQQAEQTLGAVPVGEIQEAVLDINLKNKATETAEQLQASISTLIDTGYGNLTEKEHQDYQKRVANNEEPTISLLAEVISPRVQENLTAAKNHLSSLTAHMPQQPGSVNMDQITHAVARLTRENEAYAAIAQIFEASETLKDTGYTILIGQESVAEERPTAQLPSETKSEKESPYVPNAQSGAMKKILAVEMAGDQIGRFVYDDLQEIANGMIKSDQKDDPKTQTAASKYLSVTKANLNKALRDMAEKNDARTMAELMELALQGVKDQGWGEIYGHIKATFGHLTPEAFIRDVINRFAPQIPEGWTSLLAVTNGYEVSITKLEESCMQYLPFGQHFRQTPKGFQLSQRGASVVKRVLQNPKKSNKPFEEALAYFAHIDQERMHVKPTTWDGNFRVYSFLRNQAVFQTLKDELLPRLAGYQTSYTTLIGLAEYYGLAEKGAHDSLVAWIATLIQQDANRGDRHTIPNDDSIIRQATIEVRDVVHRLRNSSKELRAQQMEHIDEQMLGYQFIIALLAEAEGNGYVLNRLHELFHSI